MLVIALTAEKSDLAEAEAQSELRCILNMSQSSLRRLLAFLQPLLPKRQLTSYGPLFGLSFLRKQMSGCTQNHAAMPFQKLLFEHWLTSNLSKLSGGTVGTICKMSRDWAQRGGLRDLVASLDDFAACDPSAETPDVRTLPIQYDSAGERTLAMAQLSDSGCPDWPIKGRRATRWMVQRV